MNIKKQIEINKAIEEAMQFGFTRQLVFVNGMIKKMFSDETFFKEDFATVRTYPINSITGYKGTISYIVLNDGTLGYILKENKRQLRTRLLTK